MYFFHASSTLYFDSELRTVKVDSKNICLTSFISKSTLFIYMHTCIVEMYHTVIVKQLKVIVVHKPMYQFDASRGSRYWSRMWTTRGVCISNGSFSSAELFPSATTGSSSAWVFRLLDNQTENLLHG